MALKYANLCPEADEHIPSDLSFGSETFAEVLTDVENIHINPTGKGHKSQVDAYFHQCVLPQGPKRWPAVLDELTTSFQRMSMHRAVESFFSLHLRGSHTSTKKVAQSSHTSTNNRKMAFFWLLID